MNIIDRLNDEKMYVDAIDDAIAEMNILYRQVAELREALTDMVYQFAYTDESSGRLTIRTRGLSALESAFLALEWPDPKPVPEQECDIAGCHKEATCGTPTPGGYRNVCGKHFRELTSKG